VTTAEAEQPTRGPAWLRRAIQGAIDRTEERKWVRYVAAAAVVLFVVALSVATIANIRNADPDDSTSRILSYVGLAIVSFTCCSVPIPGVAPILYSVVIYCGYALNPFVVAVVAGLAMALGEGVSYMLGALGLRIVEKRSDDHESSAAEEKGTIARLLSWGSQHVDEWMDKRGFLTLLVLAAVPNPIVALANITAGATGMPFMKFYTAVAIGKTIRSLVLAGIGVWLRSVV
jgi:membrane protein YqaA with SNARE-associated domain